mmetsp:Transcript_91016/g.161206  ORF Transcript_91016/g.161206 Transcript_91016/m.161206 type:complete len:111 (+) Transcript_91016:441-773(+)
MAQSNPNIANKTQCDERLPKKDACSSASGAVYSARHENAGNCQSLSDDMNMILRKLLIPLSLLNLKIIESGGLLPSFSASASKSSHGAIVLTARNRQRCNSDKLFGNRPK